MAVPDLSTLTPDELMAVLQDASTKLQAAQQAAAQTEQQIRDTASVDVDAVLALIGDSVQTYKDRVAADPAYVLPKDKINALIAQRNADVRTDPAPTMMAALRLLRRLAQAQVSASRVAAGRYDGTSVGAGE